jgi:hypothetical protein
MVKAEGKLRSLPVEDGRSKENGGGDGSAEGETECEFKTGQLSKSVVETG